MRAAGLSAAATVCVALNVLVAIATGQKQSCEDAVSPDFSGKNCSQMCKETWFFKKKRLCCAAAFAPGKPYAGNCSNFCGTCNGPKTGADCVDTFSDTDMRGRTCNEMCFQSWSFSSKAACCDAAFVPGKAYAGRCNTFCNLCGVELPVVHEDPTCKDTMYKPGCMLFCNNYFGYFPGGSSADNVHCHDSASCLKKCCSDMYASGKQDAGKCNHTCGFCEAKNETVTLVTVDQKATHTPPPPPGAPLLLT